MIEHWSCEVGLTLGLILTLTLALTLAAKYRPVELHYIFIYPSKVWR